MTLAAAVAGWIYLYDTLSETQMWIGFVFIVLLIGMFVGYMTAQNFQRRMDTLHFAILQLANGNLSGRIPVEGADSFERVYRDFNEMTASLEQRVKLLQKLGEENVLLLAESNEEAVQEERRRLARDLHDSVSQQLFAIHMSASSLPKVLDADLNAAKQVVDQLIHISNHAQKQMRGLIAQLRPMELEGRSLADALDKWFPDYCRQNGLQGTLDFQVADGISEAKEHQLFLIIQEGMANIVKHALAKHASLSLYDIGHQYVLTIVDDGKGFDKGTVKSGSYGLTTMRERAQKLGGELEVLSKAGAGTRMKVHIPKFD